MNVVLWFVSVWLAGSVWFLAGCWWVGRSRDRWQVRALVAEANTDHALCEDVHTAMTGYIAYQEHALDAYRAGSDLADEAEMFLQEREP